MPSFSGVAVSACFGLRKPSNLQAKYVKDDTVGSRWRGEAHLEAPGTTEPDCFAKPWMAGLESWWPRCFGVAEFTPHFCELRSNCRRWSFFDARTNHGRPGEPSRNTRNCLEIDHLTPAAPSRKALARVKQIYVASWACAFLVKSIANCKAKPPVLTLHKSFPSSCACTFLGRWKNNLAMCSVAQRCCVLPYRILYTVCTCLHQNLSFVNYWVVRGFLGHGRVPPCVLSGCVPPAYMFSFQVSSL